jgi:Tol biopolymer transport system component
LASVLRGLSIVDSAGMFAIVAVTPCNEALLAPCPILVGVRRSIPVSLLLLAAMSLVFAAAANSSSSGAGGRQDRPVAWSPDGGSIVFERSQVDHGGDFEVFLDGRGVVRLPDEDSEFSFSPDGRRLVFLRGDFGTASDGIFVSDVARRDVHRLTRQVDPELSDDVLGWAPGGDWVAFQRTRLRRVSRIGYEEIASNIWLVRPDGSGLHRLSSRRGSDWGASWSPDGRQIVFARQSRRIRNDLYIADVATGVERRLTYGADNDVAAWSPRGDVIVFERGRDLAHDSEVDLWSIRPDGSHLRDLTPFKGGDTNPVWSPDGRTIVFQVDSRRQNRFDWDTLEELWLMRPDGTHQRPLFPHYSVDTVPQDSVPVWSPDSKRIAFGRFDYGSAESGGMSLHVVRADGRHAIRLTY